MLGFFVGKLGLKFFPGWVADAHLREVFISSQTHSINITFDTWPKAALRWRGVSAMAGLNRLFW
jgi:hypothetical protein